MAIESRVKQAVKLLLADQIQLRQFIELSHEIVMQAYKNLGNKQGTSADDPLPEVISMIKPVLFSFDVTKHFNTMDSSLKELIDFKTRDLNIEGEKVYSFATVLSAMKYALPEVQQQQQLNIILKKILAGVNEGIALVEKKKKELKENNCSKAENKIATLDEALEIENDWPFLAENKKNLKGLKYDIEQHLISKDKLSIETITNLQKRFNTIVEEKINKPFAKHADEVTFTTAVSAWFKHTKEKISDGIKKCFGVGTLSTRGTLFAIKKDVGRFFTIADKKARGMRPL